MKKEIVIIFGLFSILILLISFVSALNIFNIRRLPLNNVSCRECNLAIRGDANNDCRIDISDVVYINSHLFRGREFCNRDSYYEPADVNGDFKIDISDSRYLKVYLFRGGPAPMQLRQQQICTDSDGGNNQNVLGILTNSTGTFSDYCAGTRLWEHSCVDGKTRIDVINCQNGCSNGVCNTTTPPLNGGAGGGGGGSYSFAHRIVERI